MPVLPPLAANNTNRMFIKYTSGGVQHEAVIRLMQSAAQDKATALFNALLPKLQAITFTTDSIIGARWQGFGSLFSFPMAVTGGAGTLAGTGSKGQHPEFVSWTGRSGDGRRVRFTWFTQAMDVPAGDYRVEQPGTAYTDIRAILADQLHQVVTISNQFPVWNTYLNYGVNSYFQRKIRRTG